TWDETGLCVTAGAGVVLADLEETLSRHQYTLGSLPQSARIATVGGAVATEAFGLFAAGYGGMRENTLALEAVLPGGEVIRTSASGAASRTFHHLLIGTEGAFGIVTSATLAIRPVPEVRAWCAFAFGTFADAADALRLIYRSDARPAFVRLFDAAAARERFAGVVPGGNVLLLLGVEGSEIVQTGQYQTVFAVCKQVGGEEVAVDGDAWYESDRFRTDAFAANGRSGAIADVISVYTPWSSANAVYRALSDGLQADVCALTTQIGYATPHGVALDMLFVAETASPEDAIARHGRVLQNAREIALTHGANVAHHYGVGVARAGWADAERGSAQTEALRRMRTAQTKKSPAGL
ncbi:MAG: FAD-binding oxidoreductase, partial [Akkermansiaceae bacterium]|nr:FAD-binding oxidoreductase [Armatimonadota bacterium]